MDHQGHNQNPQMGVVGSGGQMPYGSNLYQSILQQQQQQQQQLQQKLQAFWQNQAEEIEKDMNIKNHSLPLARIKKIMKADEDVRMISSEVPVLFSKACEMFISDLTLRSWNQTEGNKRKTLSKSDIAAAITKTDVYDFLVDIVPREDEALASIPRGTMAVGGPSDALQYCYMPPQQPVMDPNMYAEQPHPFMAPQMWPQPSDQGPSSPDH